MAKYRKKPIVIEAVQWFPGIEIAGLRTTYGEAGADYGSGIPGAMVSIRTLEGSTRVSPGDWIITGVNGEKYPCKPDIFEKSYEPADEVAAIRHIMGGDYIEKAGRLLRIATLNQLLDNNVLSIADVQDLANGNLDPTDDTTYVDDSALVGLPVEKCYEIIFSK